MFSWIFTAIALALGLAVLASLILIADSMFGGLDFATGRAARRQLMLLLADRSLPQGLFLDLGSGNGRLSSKVAKRFPELEVVGIDNSFLRIFLARRFGAFHKNIRFFRQDIFLCDVSAADFIYLYLPKELAAELEIKLRRELKPGALAITNRVSFPNWKFSSRSADLFIYQQ